MKRIFLLCFLLAPFICHADDVTVVVGQPILTGSGTDWTADSTMKALYLFESSPGIEQDSKNTNHISGAINALEPSADTSTYIEGTQSAYYGGGNTDASILYLSAADADFPLNGTGDGEITIACWIQIDAFSTGDYVFSVNQDFQLGFGATNTLLGQCDGSSTVTGGSTQVLDTGLWFVALVYSDTADYFYIYTRKQGSGSSVYDGISANIGTLDSGSASYFAVGGRADSATTALSIQGSIDAMAVFNGKALSQAELDGIFTYGWDGNGW